MSPAVSIVIPAYNEGASIVPILDGLLADPGRDVEVLVVYDSDEDTTAPAVREYASTDPRAKPTLNTYGRGPANAIRYGLDHAAAPVTVVMMADGSDDPLQVDSLAAGVMKGSVVAAASRYMKGGRQLGGPFIKRTLSRLAGHSLYYLGRVGTHDATNSYKAYSTEFVRRVGVESDQGFEIGIELVAKARRVRLHVTEIPTTWMDRTEGESRFKVTAWIPYYLRWYVYAFGPKRTLEQLEQARVGRAA
jgi:dolichol-phosphate mannosyltransferase